MNFVDLEYLLTSNFCCICSIKFFSLSFRFIDICTSSSNNDESSSYEYSTQSSSSSSSNDEDMIHDWNQETFIFLQLAFATICNTYELFNANELEAGGQPYVNPT